MLLWPTWLSYAVSYLFIAIVWINHHYLLRYATEATPRLLWFNFAHLFSMSLLPLSVVARLHPPTPCVVNRLGATTFRHPRQGRGKVQPDGNGARKARSAG